MNNKYAKESYIQPDPDINSVFWENNITSVLVKEYSPYMKGCVADFGCNHGLSITKISKLKQVEKCIGFDLNEEALAVALNTVSPQVSETKHKISFVKANLTKIPVKDDSFDFVLCFHTLEHIYEDDVDLVVKEMLRTLKKGGYVLINMPDKHSVPWEQTHVYKPSLNELNELMTKHGFITIESYHDERGGQVGISRNLTGLYKKESMKSDEEFWSEI